MTINKIICTLLIGGFVTTGVSADTQVSEQNLKYYVVEAKPRPEIFKQLVENPADPAVAASRFISNIKGAKLIDYYMKVGTPYNMAIIAVPDSIDAATILYQRMATELVEDIEVYEVIRGDQFVKVLEAAKALNQYDSYKKK